MKIEKNELQFWFLSIVDSISTLVVSIYIIVFFFDSKNNFEKFELSHLTKFQKFLVMILNIIVNMTNNFFSSKFIHEIFVFVVLNNKKNKIVINFAQLIKLIFVKLKLKHKTNVSWFESQRFWNYFDIFIDCFNCYLMNLIKNFDVFVMRE